MTHQNHAQSIRDRLLNMASGDNKTFQQLIVRYFHERLLYRLSESQYKNHFILKGGALLYAYEEFVPRPTIDIDFMGQHINNDKQIILDVFKTITDSPYNEDGIQFQPNTMTAENITVEKKYPGIRICMVGNLGTYRQKLTLDIGFGDVIVPRPIELDYPTLFDSMTEPKIFAYSLETVVAEKFHTMIDRGVFNSRMKDYFDLYRIFKAHKFVNDELDEAVRATFTNRGTRFIENHEFFNGAYATDEMLNQQWRYYCKKMKLDLPTFDKIMEYLGSKLSSSWENLQNK